MARYRIVTTFNNTSGVPEDDFVSGFYFRTEQSAVNAEVGNLLSAHVESAYGAAAAEPGLGGAALMTFLSPVVDRTNRPTTLAYNAEGGSPLHPPRVWAGLPAASDTYPLPPQIALALSFRSDYGTALEFAPDDADPDAGPERPRARLRGRSYFGPLIRNCINVEFGQPRPNGGLRSALIDLAERLHAIPAGPLTAAGVNAAWVVLSKGSGLPMTHSVVTTAWVDNAFDVQRRRAIDPTERTSRTL